MKTKFLFLAFAAFAFFSSCEKDKTENDRITFESFDLGPDGYYNGSDQEGDFIIGNAIFSNSLIRTLNHGRVLRFRIIQTPRPGV